MSSNNWLGFLECSVRVCFLRTQTIIFESYTMVSRTSARTHPLEALSCHETRKWLFFVFFISLQKRRDSRLHDERQKRRVTRTFEASPDKIGKHVVFRACLRDERKTGHSQRWQYVKRERERERDNYEIDTSANKETRRMLLVPWIMLTVGVATS